MSNPWFRLYSEFSHDPKVQMLSEAMQRRYIMLMCLRCSNALVTLHETEVAFHLRISNDDMAETKALFIAKGFIDSEWNLLNWEKRQFASDTSNARVAKHRALQKEKQSKDGNGDVTLPKRNDNALDTEQNRTDKSNTPKPPSGADVRFEEFWTAYPKKIGKDAARRAFDKRKPDANLLARMSAAIASQGKSAEWAKDAGQFIPNPATWLNQGRWQDEEIGATPTANAKPGTPEYAKLHKDAEWWREAGFSDVWDANSSMCWSHNAQQFHAGKRAEVAA